jgi:HEAT repeat protein
LGLYVTGGSVIDFLPNPKADEAVRRIGTNAIPALLYMLKARDSRLKVALLRWQDKHDFIIIRSTSAVFMNWEAPVAFHALGADASNAVPQIVQIYRDRVSLNSQRACVAALGWLGPVGKAGLPDLMGAATNLDGGLRANAIQALGNIGAKPDLVVPLLTESLQDSDTVVRIRAVRALAQYGADAKSAIPALRRALNDLEYVIQLDAAAALRAIELENTPRADLH